MAFSPDGQWLGCDNDSVLRIVDSRGAAPDLVISIPAISSPPVSETWRPLVFSPSEQEIYRLSSNFEFTKWNLHSQRAIYHQRPNSEEGGQFEPNSLAVSPDGRRLAAASYLAMNPGTSASVVETLDADNLQTIQSTRQSQEVRAIAFTDGGQSLAVLQRGALEIWDAETLKPKTHLALQLEIDHPAVAPDAHKLALADGQTVYLFDGQRFHEIVDIRPSFIPEWLMISAFALVLILWQALRHRRKIGRKVKV